MSEKVKMSEDLTALKDKIIISQQKQIRALQAEFYQLKQDNIELNVILYTLSDNQHVDTTNNYCYCFDAIDRIIEDMP